MRDDIIRRMVKKERKAKSSPQAAKPGIAKDAKLHLSQREVRDSPAIEQTYAQAEANAEIILGESEAVIELPQETLTGRGIARIQFEPKPREYIDVVLNKESKHLEWEALASVFGPRPDSGKRKWDRKVKFSGFPVEVEPRGRDGDGPHRFFIPRRWISLDKASPMSTVTFSLFNFPHFHGPDDYVHQTKVGESGHRSTLCGRVTLLGGGWRVTIAGFPETSKRVELLASRGGYVITHAGRIERSDGSSFSRQQLEQLMTCLHYFLSFCVGTDQHCTLPVGFDSAGDMVFREWSLPLLTPTAPAGGLTCFDHMHTAFLPDLFPRFFELWSQELWRETLKGAIYWYLCANDSVVAIRADAGIILAQTAVELLAWNYCVKDRRLVSSRAFGRGGLIAADKMRLLLRSLKIPTKIPQALDALRRSKSDKITDVADAVTTVRNSLVHPGTDRDLKPEVIYETWTLSLWLLEIVILRLCGYNGKYGNRLESRFSGQVEDLPQPD